MVRIWLTDLSGRLDVLGNVEGADLGATGRKRQRPRSCYVTFASTAALTLDKDDILHRARRRIQPRATSATEGALDCLSTVGFRVIIHLGLAFRVLMESCEVSSASVY